MLFLGRHEKAPALPADGGEKEQGPLVSAV